jgi:hypothetical protein
MTDREKIILIALGEVGYKEKATNAQLDDKAANAGSGDYTKYARDLFAAGYYNGNKNGYAWCDVFVDWCFFQAFGAAGQEMECQTGKLGAGCKYSAGYYKAAGRFDDEPQAGDQVFFQRGGNIGHTGLVVAVSGSKVTVVEGNAGNMVKKVVYTLPLARIAGYGHPKYQDVPETASAPPEWEFSRVLELQTPSQTGEDVKAVQNVLVSMGYSVGDCGIDGEYGPDTAAAVKLYQAKAFATGKVDAATAEKLGAKA